MSITIDIPTLKEDFCSIYSLYIHREGANEFLEWLKTTDFFTAPASSKYHLAIPGGLLQHSLNVFKRLRQVTPNWVGANYTIETLTLVSLLHDICKVNTYKEIRRNVKTYDKEKVATAEPNQVKHDATGNYIWESIPAYEIDDQFLFGHGEKSVYLINQFMKLTDEEAQAIRFHMSSWKHDDISLVGKVYSANYLAFFLHVADEMATYLDENDD